MLWKLIKIVGIPIGLIAATIWLLSAFDIAKPGTLQFEAPDREPCHRQEQANGAERITVQWIWTTAGYGWGCYYRYEDGTTAAVAPMPK